MREYYQVIRYDSVRDTETCISHECSKDEAKEAVQRFRKNLDQRTSQRLTYFMRQVRIMGPPRRTSPYFEALKARQEQEAKEARIRRLRRFLKASDDVPEEELERLWLRAQTFPVRASDARIARALSEFAKAQDYPEPPPDRLL